MTMDKMLKWYQTRLQNLSIIQMMVELNVLCFVMKALPGLMLPLFITEPFQTTTDVMMEQQSELFVLFTSVLIAPPLETIIGQWMPIVILTFFTRRLFHLLFWSALFFAVLHLYAGWISVFIVFFPGFVFSLCFVSQWEKSFWRAYWMTTLLHALHNLLSLIFYFSLL